MNLWRLKIWNLESELDLGREGAAEALARAREMCEQQRQRSRIAIILFATPLALAYFVAFIWWVNYLSSFSTPWWLLASLPAAAVPPIIVFIIMRHRLKKHLLQALRHHGYELCPKCGYWLRGLDGRVKNCPECGAKRE